MNDLLTVFEVAGKLGGKTRPEFVRELLRTEQLYGFKVGDEWRIPQAAVDEYLAANANNAASTLAPPLRRKVRGKRSKTP